MIQAAEVCAANFGYTDLSSSIWATATLSGGRERIPLSLGCAAAIANPWLVMWQASHPAYCNLGLGLHLQTPLQYITEEM